MQAILILYENRGKIFPIEQNLHFVHESSLMGSRLTQFMIWALVRHEKHEVPQSNFGLVVYYTS